MIINNGFEKDVSIDFYFETAAIRTIYVQTLGGENIQDPIFSDQIKMSAYVEVYRTYESFQLIVMRRDEGKWVNDYPVTKGSNSSQDKPIIEPIATNPFEARDIELDYDDPKRDCKITMSLL